MLMAGLRNDEVARHGPGHRAAWTADDFVSTRCRTCCSPATPASGSGPGAITSLAMPARRRETQLTELIYTFHPRFAGVERSTAGRRSTSRAATCCCWPTACWRSASASGRRRRAPSGWPGGVRAGLAHTILAVPIDQDRATMHLDTICTMVDADAMVMYPNVADTLVAWTVTPSTVGRDATASCGRRPGAVPAAAAAPWASNGCGSSTPGSTR